MSAIYWTDRDLQEGRCSRADVGMLKPGMRKPTKEDQIAAREARKAERARKLAEKALVPGKVPSDRVPTILRDHYATEQEWLAAVRRAEKALATKALQQAHHAALKPGDALQQATRLRRARKLVTEASASTATEAPVEQFTAIIEGMDGQPIDLSQRYDRQFYQTETGEWGNRHLGELQARDPVVVDVVARLPAETPTEATESTPAPLEPWKATNPFTDESARRHGAAVPSDGFDERVAALKRAIQEIEDLL